MFNKILIANRGEIAVRIIRTAKKLGIGTVAVYSEADKESLHVLAADEAVWIGKSPAHESYLNQEAIIKAALSTGAEAIHPGYGFLSENADFAKIVQDSGVTFIGPTAEVIEIMGDKARARKLAISLGVPVAKGSQKEVSDLQEAKSAALNTGFPVMLKAAAGGGGIGMTVVEDETQLEKNFLPALTRAERVFGNPGMLIEQYIKPARHIEIQVLGLNTGEILVLGERDCSVQRRYQKVVEETPAPNLDEKIKNNLFEQAKKICQAVNYIGAGTIEFLVSPLTGEFIFLEMNTRLQVEHPITEEVLGIDLVEMQIQIAAGRDPQFNNFMPEGHSIEFRLYAENPKNFFPSPGNIEEWKIPNHDWLRVDAGVREGSVITPYYDPLIAKIIVTGKDRDEALSRAGVAINEIRVGPLITNLEVFAEVLKNESFVRGEYNTSLLDR